MKIILSILIVSILFLIFAALSFINQRYKKDVSVRGFVGNCEKCSSFSCHKHPQNSSDIEGENK